jgi:uncharacterized protein with NRDE domain
VCLIALAWRARADLPLVVAANRDEWRERPTQAAHWWMDDPEILAGKDLRAGGTWMGITRAGRFAAVTNFRDPSDKRSTARSRGVLVTDFLLGSDTPARFLSELAARAHEFNGFNVIVGDGASLLYFGSRENLARPVEPGIHALSNHLLDEPWPKVVRARQHMEEAMAVAEPAAQLFEMLSGQGRADDQALPDTGVGIAWERRLSAALITGEDYGTRASTVMTLAADGEVDFEERTRDANGAVSGVARQRFRLREAVAT